MTLFVAYPHTPFYALIKVYERLFHFPIMKMIERKNAGCGKAIPPYNYAIGTHVLVSDQLRRDIRSERGHLLFLFLTNVFAWRNG